MSNRLFSKYKFVKKVLLPIPGLQYTQLVFQVVAALGFMLFICIKKPYQKSYGVSSSVVIKPKGIGLTNLTNDQRIIWDSTDSVVPPMEENGLFFTTNYIATYKQTQDVCPENPEVKNSICITHDDCQKDKILYRGNGVMTGKCVQATPNSKTCEIKSWCPLEDDTMNETLNNLINGTLDYTVLIKNTVVFDNLGVVRSNIFDDVENFTTECIYNSSDNLSKYCPIFKISSFFDSINEKKLQHLFIYGGIVRININWNCDLDESVDLCKPAYSFSIIFTKSSIFNKGMNFRYANYYENQSKEYRTLFKVYGLRILVEVRGDGRQFDRDKTIFLISTFMNCVVLVEKIVIWIVELLLCCKRFKPIDRLIYEDSNLKSVWKTLCCKKCKWRALFCKKCKWKALCCKKCKWKTLCCKNCKKGKKSKMKMSIQEPKRQVSASRGVGWSDSLLNENIELQGVKTCETRVDCKVGCNNPGYTKLHNEEN